MSSDTAVNPTSVMGTSKLMGEQLISAENMSLDQAKAQALDEIADRRHGVETADGTITGPAFSLGGTVILIAVYDRHGAAGLNQSC